VSSLVLSLTPLALATVVSPLVFMSLFVVLGGDRPVVQGFTFVAGLGAAVAATAAVSALVLGRRPGPVAAGSHGIAWIDLTLGICELASGVWLWFRGAPPWAGNRWPMPRPHPGCHTIGNKMLLRSGTSAPSV
jgi:hypothetical protein